MKNEKEKEKPLIYSVEECQQCKHKVKRTFNVGDYIYKMGETCSKCNSSMLITMIYAEYVKI